MCTKRWKHKEECDYNTVNHLSETLGVGPVIATLLVQRGVNTFQEAKDFFRPSLTHLHDPFLMKDMDRAIDRLEQALSQSERIMVYGDYDVDGTSAVALLYSYLRDLGYDQIDFYIPDREKEGYGISYDGIDFAVRSGVKLIVALDCGIKAVEQVRYAKERGVDFIIGDHHLPGDELPPAAAVLDAKRPDCPYPFKELSGCGVAFKIVQACMQRENGVGLWQDPSTLTDEQRSLQAEMQHDLCSYLDLVAISIASDIVPILGENRVLATFGLGAINTHPRPGIEAILSYSRVQPRQADDRMNNPENQNYFARELTISDLVFLVGPRINAAGRLFSAFDSVRLLLCQDMDSARKLAYDIDKYNEERKRLDSVATEQAKQILEDNPVFLKSPALILFDETWHKGVVGIVASRLVEMYGKPAIVFTKADDLLVGSARSNKDFDIHAALEECSDLLEHFGGHRCAAGVSLSPDHWTQFLQRFLAYVRENLPEESTIPEIEYDAELSLGLDVTPKFLRILKQFAPFGPGNNAPLFVSRGLVDSGSPRIVGEKHLKLQVVETAHRSGFFSAIAFQQAAYFKQVRSGKRFDLCYSLEENHWNGKTEMQLNVKDFHFQSDNNKH